MMKMNSKIKIMIPTVMKMHEDSDDSDNDDVKDMYDKMDPDAITALSDPTTLQDDEDSE